MTERKKNKAIFVVETPLHLFSYVCYVLAHKEIKTFTELEVLILAQFSDCHELGQRVESTKLFDRVIYAEPYYENSRGESLKHVMKLLTQRRKSEDSFFGLHPSLRAEDYNTIFCASVSLFVIDIKYFCGKNATTILVEDGIGSYNGSIAKPFSFFDEIVSYENVSTSLSESVKRYAKRCFNLLTQGKMLLHPKELYLFRIDDNVKKVYKSIYLNQLILPVGSDKALLSEIFPHNSKDLYQNSAWIFLSLPSGLNSVVLEAEKGLVNFIQKTKDDLLIRHHPRSNMRYAEEASVKIDYYNELWESLAFHGAISDDHTIFGFGSSAQISPKMIFGLEPHIVFLHKLLRINDSFLGNIEYIVRELKNVYANPEKIYAPESLDELNSILLFLQNGEQIQIQRSSARGMGCGF